MAHGHPWVECWYHLAAMIRSSKKLPFFSQLDSATSWSRDSPLADGTHLDTSFGEVSKIFRIFVINRANNPNHANFLKPFSCSPKFIIQSGFCERTVGIKKKLQNL